LRTTPIKAKRRLLRMFVPVIIAMF